MCEAVSESTGSRCQQPERWRMWCMHSTFGAALGIEGVRELHPVPGFERVAP